MYPTLVHNIMVYCTCKFEIQLHAAFVNPSLELSTPLFLPALHPTVIDAVRDGLLNGAVNEHVRRTKAVHLHTPVAVPVPFLRDFLPELLPIITDVSICIT